MQNKIQYYAIVDDLSSREQPAGVLRRIYIDTGGRRDEAFSQHLIWERTAMLVSAERGDLQNEFLEITEDEANHLVEKLRARWTSAGGGLSQQAPRAPGPTHGVGVFTDSRGQVPLGPGKPSTGRDWFWMSCGLRIRLSRRNRVVVTLMSSGARRCDN